MVNVTSNSQFPNIKIHFLIFHTVRFHRIHLVFLAAATTLIKRQSWANFSNLVTDSIFALFFYRRHSVPVRTVDMVTNSCSTMNITCRMRKPGCCKCYSLTVDIQGSLR